MVEVEVNDNPPETWPHPAEQALGYVIVAMLLALWVTSFWIPPQ